MLTTTLVSASGAAELIGGFAVRVVVHEGSETLVIVVPSHGQSLKESQLQVGRSRSKFDLNSSNTGIN